MTLKNKARKHWPKVVVILFSTIEIVMSIQHARRRKAFLEAMDVSVNLTAAKPEEYAYLQSMADEQHRKLVMSLLKPVLYTKAAPKRPTILILRAGGDANNDNNDENKRKHDS
ncbi:hypothetical protein BGZ81_009132 [Podila clonocystis]|nr:hypothetical protein BGZ81_009132 [Podila clonocystis]